MSVSLEDLPPELVSVVLEQLDDALSLQRAAVSSGMRELAHRENLWRAHCLRSLGLGISQLSREQLDQLRGMGAVSLRKLFWQSRPLKPILHATVPGKRSWWSFYPKTRMPESLRQQGGADWVFVEFYEVNDVLMPRCSLVSLHMLPLGRLITSRDPFAVATRASADFPSWKLNLGGLSVPSNNGMADGKDFLEWRVVMQVDGVVVPVCDTFASDGEENHRFLPNVNFDRMSFMTDLIGMTDEGTRTTKVDGIGIRIEQDELEEDQKMKVRPHPNAIYGVGEAGFLAAYGSLQNALRICTCGTYEKHNGSMYPVTVGGSGERSLCNI